MSAGGLGSGFAEDETSLRRLCTDAFAHSSQVWIRNAHTCFEGFRVLH